MALHDYQIQGISFLEQRRKAYLADEMGLGKTAQAICAADRIGAKRILVVCPSSLQYNWRKEFKQWQYISRQITIYEPGSLFPKLSDVVVLNYEKLLNDALFNQIMTTSFDLIIFDEAHRLKNHRSKRTIRALGPKHDGDLGIASRGGRVWWLSGTPAPNSADELYTAMKFMGEFDKSFWAFQDQFCVVRVTSFGRKVVGQKNTAILRTKLQNTTIRRFTKDVLKELPPISYGDFALQPKDAIKMSATNEVWARVFSDRGVNPFELSPDAMVDFLKSDVDIGILRHMIGVTKAPAVAEVVKVDLETVDKVLVFAWHRGVIETLANALAEYKPAVITGDTDPQMRQLEVDRFQNSPDCRVFIGNILAAGEGITLTAANTVIFAEQSWVPKDNAQAAKRAHRIGQSRPVFVKFCYFPGTVDDLITKAVARKTRLLTELELA